MNRFSKYANDAPRHAPDWAYPEYNTMTLDELTTERDKVERRFTKLRKNTDQPNADWRDLVYRIDRLGNLIITAIMNR
jgi:hypothetical protein